MGFRPSGGRPTRSRACFVITGGTEGVKASAGLLEQTEQWSTQVLSGEGHYSAYSEKWFDKRRHYSAYSE
eukprot:1078976-Prymnesium_polylepis.1